MQNNTYKYIFKVILVGDERVGKTCMQQQFLLKKFIDYYEPTKGIDFGAIFYQIQEESIKLVIWDAGGQKEFQTFNRSYYKQCGAVLLVYSIDKRETFNNIQTWLNEIKLNGNPTQEVILVGNKQDLVDDREVSYEEAFNFAASNGIHFFEISAKDHNSVKQLFKETVQLILNNVVAGVIDLNSQNSGVKAAPQKQQNEENI